MTCEQKRKSLAGIAMLLLVCLFSPISVAAESDPKSALKNELLLVGKWMRPDGGYVLEIKDVKLDGSLKAAYFNPRPIHVAKAEWRRIADRIQIFVELRDVNYPGSTYTLIYDSAKDRFEGYYYQAAMQQTFEVIFERTK